MFYTTMHSPVGRLLLGGDGTFLQMLHMEDTDKTPRVLSNWVADPSKFRETVAQLTDYFDGERTEFDLPLAAKGTAFQKKVWDALIEIPFGETATYGEVAAAIGMPTASRAVGAANRTNPIGIIVPCHRVVGASGKLTGYAAGLDRKRLLLDHEAAVLRRMAERKELVGA